MPAMMKMGRREIGLLGPGLHDVLVEAPEYNGMKMYSPSQI